VSQARVIYSGPTAERETRARETLGGETVFSEPATQSARFRALTPVGAESGPFREVEPREKFKIRLASGPAVRRTEAARRGDPESTLPGADQDPFLFSFLAHNQGKLAGSMGVRVDSVRGLAADDMYRDELDELRAAGQKIAELVQLSVDMNSVPRRVLAGLFHTAYLFAGTVRGCDYCLLLANARHADFFYSSLGFDYVGGERVNTRTATPMALLAAHLPTVTEALARVGGRPGLATGDPTFFSHGFSPEEVAGVMKRLKSLR
jgi:hypothetical protein